MLTDIGYSGFLLFRHFSTEQVFSYNFNLLFYCYEVLFYTLYMNFRLINSRKTAVYDRFNSFNALVRTLSLGKSKGKGKFHSHNRSGRPRGGVEV